MTIATVLAAQGQIDPVTCLIIAGIIVVVLVSIRNSGEAGAKRGYRRWKRYHKIEAGNAWTRRGRDRWMAHNHVEDDDEEE